MTHILNFPIKEVILKDIVNDSFDELFTSSVGVLRIGKDIFIPPQAIGVILEKLISNKIIELFPEWKEGVQKNEKDVVNTQNDFYSFEIKTSSSKSGVFGNRSYGHVSKNKVKNRAGFYLIINYKIPKPNDTSHHIHMIRFGWIEDEDWIAQKSQSGQSASLSVECKKKLRKLY